MLLILISRKKGGMTTNENQKKMQLTDIQSNNFSIKLYTTTVVNETRKEKDYKNEINRIRKEFGLRQ